MLTVNMWSSSRPMHMSKCCRDYYSGLLQTFCVSTESTVIPAPSVGSLLTPPNRHDLETTQILRSALSLPDIPCPPMGLDSAEFCLH